MARISVMLVNTGGVLANEVVEVADDDGDLDETVNQKIHDAIETWVLAPGDSISIRSVV